jgi:hypothetical protein
MADAKELSKYKLDLAETQEVGSDSIGTEPAREYKFMYAKGN